MDQTSRVRGREPPPGAHEDLEHLGPRARALVEPRRQRAPNHELHRQPNSTLMGTDVVHGHDVAVRELGERLRLAQQLGFVTAATTATDQLERDLAIELWIIGGMHDSHATGTEQRQDDVAIDLLALVERPNPRGRPRRHARRTDAGHGLFARLGGLHRRDCSRRTAAAHPQTLGIGVIKTGSTEPPPKLPITQSASEVLAATTGLVVLEELSRGLFAQRSGDPFD